MTTLANGEVIELECACEGTGRRTDTFCWCPIGIVLESVHVDAMYLRAGILTVEEVRRSRFGGGYSTGIEFGLGRHLDPR